MIVAVVLPSVPAVAIIAPTIVIPLIAFEPLDDFGVTGYVRIAYCVAEKVILNSFDAFEKLYKEYRG